MDVDAKPGVEFSLPAFMSEIQERVGKWYVFVFGHGGALFKC